MFKLTKFILSLAVTCVFTACSSQDDIKFSCDPNADAWVKEHLDDIHKMSRSEWINADINLANPIYNAFTPEQEISFWREKIDETLKLDWSEAEHMHILALQEYLENHLYLFYESPLSESSKEDLELFTYQWISTATEQLGWDESICQAICMIGYPLKSTDGTLILPPAKKIQTLATSEPDCDCVLDNDYCDTLFGSRVECKSVKCKIAENKCGIFKQLDCNGECRPYN